MTKRINLTLDDKEAGNLGVLLAKYGGKAPEYIRTLLKNAYQFECGGYKARVGKELGVPELELSPDQICEKYGGKADTVDGVEICVFSVHGGSSSYTVPLSSEKSIKDMSQRLKLS